MLMMKKSNSRMTRQKKLIADILKGTASHPTADWIYEQARKEMTDISLGTVYRNLRVLVETGEVMELNYGNTFRRFDGNPENHYHFVCECCNCVHDIDLPLQTNLNQKIAELGHGQVMHHRLEFYGTCPKCTEISNKQKI
jgi:Fur family ferric uptake transcriptional regulator/Fur family peroxide stress response transcriptional regulator